MPWASKVRAFHFGDAISSMLTWAAELLRQLGERGVAFLQAIVARLFGSALIDANAAAAHLMHHRQQINLEPVGVARALLVEDRVRGLSNSASVATASASA